MWLSSPAIPILPLKCGTQYAVALLLPRFTGGLSELAGYLRSLDKKMKVINTFHTATRTHLVTVITWIMGIIITATSVIC